MPCLVNKHGIRADTQNLSIRLLKLRIRLGGILQFRRTDEREISRIEDPAEPFAPIITEFDLLHFVVVVRFDFAIWNSTPILAI